MAAKAVDLSDHLAGDAILDYPNLANIPTDCWDVGRFNGRIYGLPSPRGAVSRGSSTVATTCWRPRGSPVRSGASPSSRVVY